MPKNKNTTDEEEIMSEEEKKEVTDVSVADSETDALKKELESQKDQFLRLAAEYDNFRKRTEKEKASTYDNAVAATVEAFLPVADNFTLALASELVVKLCVPPETVTSQPVTTLFSV